MVSVGRLEDAVKRAEAIGCTYTKETVYIKAAEAWVSMGELEKALELLTRHINPSERAATLFRFSCIIANTDGVEKSLKILAKLQDLYKKCQCLSEIVKVSPKAIGDEHFKSILAQTYQDVLQSHFLGMQKSDALQIVAEVFVQTGDLEKAKQIVLEIRELTNKPEYKTQVMPFALERRLHSENLQYEPSNYLFCLDHNDRIKHENIRKQENILKLIAEAYWAIGNKQQAYIILASISDCTIYDECRLAFVEKCCQKGELSDALKIVQETHKEFTDQMLATVSQAYALSGDFNNSIAHIDQMIDTNLGYKMVVKFLSQKGLIDTALEFAEKAGYMLGDDLLQELVFISANNGDLNASLSLIQQISLAEQSTVLHEAALIFAKHGLIEDANRLYVIKGELNVEKQEYINVMVQITQSFIFELKSSNPPKFLEVMPDFFNVQTAITKIDYLAAKDNASRMKLKEMFIALEKNIRNAEADYRKAEDELSEKKNNFSKAHKAYEEAKKFKKSNEGYKNLVDLKDDSDRKEQAYEEAKEDPHRKELCNAFIEKVQDYEQAIRKVVKVLVAKAKTQETTATSFIISTTHQDVLGILPQSIDLYVNNENITLDKTELNIFIFCIISDALALNSQFALAIESIKIAEKALSKNRRNKVNPALEKIFYDSKNIIEQRNKYYREFFNSIKDKDRPSEIFDIFNKKSNEYLKENGILCKITRDLILAGERGLAEKLLAKVAESWTSSNEHQLLAEAYLELGLFKKAFDLIETQPVDCFISLICKSTVFEQIESGLFKKVILESLNILSWTSQFWKPIYDRVKVAEAGPSVIEQTGFLQRLLRGLTLVKLYR